MYGSAKELAKFNAIWEKYGYKKVKEWEPDYDYVVPARHSCIFFDEKLRRCSTLRRTYCRYEDCKFFKIREECICQTK